MRLLFLLLALLPFCACAQPVAESDIIGRACAGAPFSQQRGYTAQVYGTHTRAGSIPEAGIHGAALPGGETLRFGKVGDAFAFQLDPADPTTSKSKRSEISFDRNIEPDKVYWIALGVYVHDWGRLERRDAALFGTQVHAGNNSLGVGGPSFGLYTTRNGRMFRVQARYSTASTPSARNSVSVKYAEYPIPFHRWADFVLKFKHNTSGKGFLQVWMDGNMIAHHQGSLGYNTPGYKDYVKFGYYNWSPAMSSPRKVLVRSPTIVADPTGSKYRPEQLRSLLGC